MTTIQTGSDHAGNRFGFITAADPPTFIPLPAQRKLIDFLDEIITVKPFAQEKNNSFNNNGDAQGQYRQNGPDKGPTLGYLIQKA